MKPDYKWIGDVNMVNVFDTKYLEYFDDVYSNINSVDYMKYDLILLDDNREKNNLESIYSKERKCPVVACEHGNRDLSKLDSLKNRGLVFDYGFVFGKKTSKDELIPIGIPSNDNLMKYGGMDKKHILVIVNFLGNRSAPYVRFDSNVFKEVPLLELQEHYKSPVVIKLKSRNDERGYIHNVKYLREILPSNLDYSIVVDVENDNKLIAESHCVISAPSTMAFKPIQLGIPTVLLKGTGQVGLFYDFVGLVDIKKSTILNELYNQDRQEIFIESTIEGGLDFNSTSVFLKEIDKLCKEE